jgi:hypothetical protein
MVKDFTNKSLSPGNDVPQEAHQGLRILAKMIVRAIIKDTQRKKNLSPIPPSPKTE